MANIIYSDYYLPSNLIDAEDVLKKSIYPEVRYPKFIDYFIEQNRQKKIAVETELTATEMLSRLVQNLFDNMNVNPEEITYILFTSKNNMLENNVYIPYYIQSKYGFKNASIIEVYQECVGTLQAIGVADALIQSGKAEHILIMSVCYGTAEEERFTVASLAGDGASVLLMGKNQGDFTVLDFQSVSDGTYSQSVYEKRKFKSNGVLVAQEGARFIQSFLSKNNCSLEEVERLVLLNNSFAEYELYVRYLNISLNKIFTHNISCGGHLAEVDIVRNIHDLNLLRTKGEEKLYVFYGSGTMYLGTDLIYNAVIVRGN